MNEGSRPLFIWLCQSCLSLLLLLFTPASFHPPITPFECYHDFDSCFDLRHGYGNAVYIGLSSTNASKLQFVLNAAIRLTGGIPKFSHISSFIRNSFHWLPIRQRIQFKICYHVRKCLIGSAPQYLKAYCIPVSSVPSRSTFRSSARGHLVVPRTRTSMTQSRSSPIVGQSNWNKLPQSLRAQM